MSIGEASRDMRRDPIRPSNNVLARPVGVAATRADLLRDAPEELHARRTDLTEDAVDVSPGGDERRGGIAELSDAPRERSSVRLMREHDESKGPDGHRELPHERRAGDRDQSPRSDDGTGHDPGMCNGYATPAEPASAASAEEDVAADGTGSGAGSGRAPLWGNAATPASARGARLDRLDRVLSGDL